MARGHRYRSKPLGTARLGWTTGAHLARMYREPIAINGRSARVCVCYSVERPLAEPLELAQAPQLERDPRTGNKVFHGAGDKHFSFGRLGGDSGADVDSEARQLPVDDIALAGMDADADSEP